jgi:transporter family-2 protein
MLTMILFATLAGAFVSLSRSVNGRLALATSPMVASLVNHAVGLVALVAAGLVLGGLWPAGIGAVPAWAWAGGPLGVIFVASGSWFVARLGAALTALAVIAGQMVSGVALDLLTAAPGSGLARAGGVALILAGMVLAQSRR